MPVLQGYHHLIQYPRSWNVIDVQATYFGTFRIGDLLAVCNVLQHLRQREDHPELKFHIPDHALHKADYVFKFRDWLSEHTDYLTPEPSGNFVPLYNQSVWGYRGGIGDLVTIRNPHPTKKKIVIFPLLDAPYNVHRNWPAAVLGEILEGYRYDGYERILCSMTKPFYPHVGYEWSSNLIENIKHVLEAEVYVGGDTGMSHFAGVLDRGPIPHYYYCGQATQLYTLPLGFARRSKIIMYS